MRIAIMGCKSMKQNYKCSADEMYSRSWIYRAQRDFIKQAYDEYYIMSSKYGIISPDTIIEPYNASLYDKMDIKQAEVYTEEEKQQYWEKINIQLNDLTNKGEIHFHTSAVYINGLSKENRKKIKLIKQQRSFSINKQSYVKALELHNEGKTLEECILPITTFNQGQKRNKVWFYHNEYESFFGSPRNMKKWAENMFNEYYDEGDIGKIAYGYKKGYDIYKGWVCDKSLLDTIYKTKNGRWRRKKGAV